MPSVARFLLLAGGGLAVAYAFLDLRAWPVAWIALAPLFAFAPGAASTRQAALEGWVVGLAANVPAFYWLVDTIHRFGGFPPWLAIAFYAVLSTYGALQFAIVGAVLRWAGPRAPVLLAPALWTATEFLYPNLFPWRLAHTQRPVPWLIQIGDVTGPYALSFAMTWTANALVRRPFHLRSLAAPLGAVALLLSYGAWRSAGIEGQIASAPRLSVGIVQGNLALDEKRHADRFESNVARYRRLSEALDRVPDLLVWPETVVEWGIPHDDPLPPGADPFPHAPAPLLFGAVAYGGNAREREWFNSAFLRDSRGGIRDRYDKIVLMPFGEFVPLASLLPSLKDLSPNTGDFRAGKAPGVLPLSDQARIGTLICYEDLLAGHVRETVRGGATLLATLANDAWFGDSPALRQHETLALWRAIENRRYLVRATNTGLTSVIDPLGAVVASLPTNAASGMVVDTRLLDVTTAYQRVGDLFGWSVVALAAGLAAYSRRSQDLANMHDVSAQRCNWA